LSSRKIFFREKRKDLLTESNSEQIKYSVTIAIICKEEILEVK
jgi:hypothetical protein